MWRLLLVHSGKKQTFRGILANEMVVIDLMFEYLTNYLIIS